MATAAFFGIDSWAPETIQKGSEVVTESFEPVILAVTSPPFGVTLTGAASAVLVMAVSNPIQSVNGSRILIGISMFSQ
jgi:hypothetical protein